MYAEARKEDGNTKFGNQKFSEAEGYYTEAIRVERSAVYYSNRSACRMAMTNWEGAAEDAEEALKCDVNFVKAYQHLTKSLMELKKPSEAANAVLRAPMQYKSQLAEVSTTVAAAIKELANGKYKAAAHDEAIAFYSIGARLEPKNPVFFSNRSACYQAKRQWRDAVSSAREAIKADPLFAKGYLHLAKSLLQLNSPLEARCSLEEGLQVLKSEGKGNPQMEDLLKELLAKESTSATPAAAPSANSGAARADKLKEQGNAAYKAGSYPGAMKLYTAAISADPGNGAYYGNRAACWMMMQQYERAVEDCTTGLRHDVAGELGKLRARQATALVSLGKVERAMDVLEEGITKGGPHLAVLTEQRKGLEGMMTHKRKAEDALSKEDYRGAKIALNKVLTTGGMEHNAPTLLALAQAHMGLGDYYEAGAVAQKAIAADPNMQAAYLLRADSLYYMGETAKAQQHLSAALQRDPDSNAVAKRLKELRSMNKQMESLSAEIKEAHSRRGYAEVVELATKGMQIDPQNKVYQGKMYLTRAKGYNNLAIKQKGGGDPRVEGNDPEEQKAKAPGSWQRAMQDASKAIYYGDDTTAPYMLRSGALQGLERWEEAVMEIEECISKGPGSQDRSVHKKLEEAKFALKKSKREDLYKLLGVENPKTATEKEIQKAYKRKALTLHPDKQSGKTDEEKAVAEEEFKRCNEALEILTDPPRKQLWDEGHDIESIKQQMEMRKQRGHGGFF